MAHLRAAARGRRCVRMGPVRGTILALVLFLLPTPVVVSQTALQMNFTNVTGELFPMVRSLVMSQGDVTSTVNNGSDLLEAGLIGSLTFTTPGFTSGSVSGGGSFGGGGSFYLYTLYGPNLNAHFVGGEWHRMQIAPGIYQFLMVATIAGTLLLEDGESLAVHGVTVQCSLSGAATFTGFAPGDGGNTSVTAD